mmetsp:Transcript_119082/g.344429  ORF Transcript_119082/g.344429 Transcript_119082/m.344429 type:complete len:209 (-) Transcript_119082:113-739(-)
MVGLACSRTRPILESTVLSMTIVPFWHVRTTPPRQSAGSFVSLSSANLHVFAAPVSFTMACEYRSMAPARQLETRASSAERQRTCTWSSKSMSMPCTIRLVINSFVFAWSRSSARKRSLLSAAICMMTSWRALIFSKRDLLIAVDRAIALSVSMLLTLRSYSCWIFSFSDFTTFAFSMLNSCKALALISSALSLASLKIWKIMPSTCF